MKKIVLLIIDGLGDRPISQLGDKTPLEAAETPNLDYLAQQGTCGLILPSEKKPTSEGAHVALFGYNKHFLGRGPYEAAGIGMKLRQGDVALRVNFATINNNKIVDRRAGRIEKTEALAKALDNITIKGVKFLIEKSFGHRAVLVLRGKNLSAKIKGNDSHKTGVKSRKIVAENKAAKFTAEVLNEFIEKSHEILSKQALNKKRALPANYLLVRGPGKLKSVPSFKEKYGLKAACVAGGGLYKGIASILGMDVLKIKGATGMKNTDLRAKFAAVKRALKKYNFIFCHIKATDTFGHDGDFLNKRKFIAKIDKEIKCLLNEKALLVVTADHCTPCVLKDHSADPIPLLTYGNGQDVTKEFSEKACLKGGLGKIEQAKLMNVILK